MNDHAKRLHEIGEKHSEQTNVNRLRYDRVHQRIEDDHRDFVMNVDHSFAAAEHAENASRYVSAQLETEREYAKALFDLCRDMLLENGNLWASLEVLNNASLNAGKYFATTKPSTLGLSMWYAAMAVDALQAHEDDKAFNVGELYSGHVQAFPLSGVIEEAFEYKLHDVTIEMHTELLPGDKHKLLSIRFK